jgi:hypothetical protein
VSSPTHAALLLELTDACHTPHLTCQRQGRERQCVNEGKETALLKGADTDALSPPDHCGGKKSEDNPRSLSLSTSP